MTKIDIYSGFLGAGKTTLIKKLIQEAYQGQKLMLIENEFGEIGIDGGFLQDSGINIKEMNSGCICCSLVGDFNRALTQAVEEYHPDRIIIEPSGVGKLSDVISAVQSVVCDDVQLGYTVAVVDAGKVKIYQNFGEFYNNQIETASTIIMSRTDSVPQEKLDKAIALIREHNDVATLVTTPWSELTGEQLITAMEGKATLAAELARLENERLAALDEHEHHHHHHDGEECDHEHHHHDDEECCHDHEHHHHHDEECCHDHEHHHHHDEECCHDHEHHHDHDEHDEHCSCGCHGHHHHHHADDVFTSWGVETTRKFEKEAVEHALKELDSGNFGVILRAKGIVPCVDGTWLHFDFVPGEINIRTGSTDINGKLCVIGSKVDKHAVEELFGV